MNKFYAEDGSLDTLSIFDTILGLIRKLMLLIFGA